MKNLQFHLLAWECKRLLTLQFMLLLVNFPTMRSFNEFYVVEVGHEVVATTFVWLQLANSITTFEFAKAIYGSTTKIFLPIVYIKGLVDIPHQNLYTIPTPFPKSCRIWSKCYHLHWYIHVFL